MPHVILPVRDAWLMMLFRPCYADTHNLISRSLDVRLMRLCVSALREDCTMPHLTKRDHMIVQLVPENGDGGNKMGEREIMIRVLI